MNENSKSIDSKQSKILRLFLFCLIYFCYDTLLFGTNINSMYTNIGKSLYIIACFPLLFYILLHRIKVNSLSFVTCIGVVFSILVTMITNHEKTNVYILMISAILVSLFLTSIIKYEEFLVYYSDIIYFLAGVSLVVYVLRLTFPSIFTHFPIVTNISYLLHRNYFLGSFSIPDNYRNQSIFRESGVNVIFLFIATYIELFKVSQLRAKRLLVFFCTMVTTFSTTGFVTAIILVGIYFLNSNISLKRKFGISVLLGTICLFIVLYANNLLRSTGVFSKFKGGTSNISFVARWSSIVSNIKIFMESPIFGVGEYGLSNRFGETAFEILSVEVRDNTNTFLSMFSGYGFFVGLLCVLGWFRILREKRGILSVVLFISFFLLFSGENMWHNMIFWVFVFYGLNSHIYTNEEVDECIANK